MVRVGWGGVGWGGGVGVKVVFYYCWQTALRDSFYVRIYRTLIKKETKFSSYIRKSRREQLQSHIWLMGSSYMIKYLRISSYVRKPFLIYDFATAPIWISLYLRKILFSFLSVYYIWGNIESDDSAGTPDGEWGDAESIGVKTECWPCTPTDFLHCKSRLAIFPSLFPARESLVGDILFYSVQQSQTKATLLEIK